MNIKEYDDDNNPVYMEKGELRDTLQNQIIELNKDVNNLNENLDMTDFELTIIKAEQAGKIEWQSL